MNNARPILIVAAYKSVIAFTSREYKGAAIGNKLAPSFTTFDNLLKLGYSFFIFIFNPIDIKQGFL